jgi:uncharacterized protein Usg
VFLLSTLLEGTSTSLDDSPAEDQAIRWLAVHGTPADVVLAPFFFGNAIPERTPVRVVAGHSYQTYDLGTRYPQLLTFFGAHSTIAQRLSVVRKTHATLVAYDGRDLEEGSFDPRGLPGTRVVFSYGNVTLVRVLPGA